MKKYLLIFLSPMLFFACKMNDNVEPSIDNELLTRVELTFTDPTTKTSSTFIYQDKDGDPKTAPERFDKIVLHKGTTYTMSIGIFDDTKSPVTDVSESIKQESDIHLFVFKIAPAGLLSTTITDKDINGLPIGLASSVITSSTAGIGKYNVLLKHQPEVNGVKVKNGQEAGGSTDVDLLFDIEVK